MAGTAKQHCQGLTTRPIVAFFGGLCTGHAESQPATVIRALRARKPQTMAVMLGHLLSVTCNRSYACTGCSNGTTASVQACTGPQIRLDVFSNVSWRETGAMHGGGWATSPSEYHSAKCADDPTAGQPDDMRHDEIIIGGSKCPPWLQQASKLAFAQPLTTSCFERSATLLFSKQYSSARSARSVLSLRVLPQRS